MDKSEVRITWVEKVAQDTDEILEQKRRKSSNNNSNSDNNTPTVHSLSLQSLLAPLRIGALFCFIWMTELQLREVE